MPDLRWRLKGLLLLHKIRAFSREMFRLIFFLMGFFIFSLGVDSATQATRLLTTSSQGALFLPPNEYKYRHNRVRQYIRWNICNHYDIETPGRWYEHKPLYPKKSLGLLFRTQRTVKAGQI